MGGQLSDLQCAVNDITDELMDLDTEAKPESLWWTSSYLLRKWCTRQKKEMRNAVRKNFFNHQKQQEHGHCGNREPRDPAGSEPI